MGALVNEARMVAGEVSSGDMRVTSFHNGGGSPDYIPGPALRMIVDEIRERFVLDQSAEISIEVDPGRLQSDDLSTLSSIGFNVRI